MLVSVFYSTALQAARFIASAGLSINFCWSTSTTLLRVYCLTFYEPLLATDGVHTWGTACKAYELLAVLSLETTGAFLDEAKTRRNCLPLWVDQGDGGVVGSTKD